FPPGELRVGATACPVCPLVARSSSGGELAPTVGRSRVPQPEASSGVDLSLSVSTNRLAWLGAVAVAAVAAGTAAAAPPQLVAKRAQARRVIAQIDARLSVVTEQFDGARLRLQRVRAQLRGAQAALARARVQNRQAQLNEARLVVSLYTTGRPTALEVLLGANSVADLLRLTDAEDAISREVASVADAATRAKRELAVRSE